MEVLGFQHSTRLTHTNHPVSPRSFSELGVYIRGFDVRFYKEVGSGLSEDIWSYKNRKSSGTKEKQKRKR